MSFRYVNVSSGQVIESDERVPSLDVLARWERSEGSKAEPEKPKAVKPPTPRKPKPETPEAQPAD